MRLLPPSRPKHMSILKPKTKKNTVASEDAQVVDAPVVATKKAPKAKKAAVASVGPKTISRFAADTIVGPLVTEKAAHMSSNNVMVFEVAVGATRVAIKQAIREIYKVTPVKVNVMNVRGNKVRFGRFNGVRKATKKAMVTLPAGTHIDVFAS